MRYFHGVTFFNELDLLKILCQEIKSLDYTIVLVEATHTHTGDPKELVFEQNKHLFSNYNIRHIIVEDLPNNGDAWANENYQRDCILRGLADCKDEDVIFIGDLDEIPRKEAIEYYDSRMGTAGLCMDKYSVFINLLEGIQNWSVAKITTWDILKETTPNKLRNSGPNFIINYAGWHISFLGGIEKMKEKLFAYAHTESVTSKLLDNLEYKYATGQSLWGNDHWRFVKIDKTFPKYIQHNQQEFKHLIREV